MTLTIPFVPVSPTRTRSQELSRWLLIAAATLVLCSCRGLDPFFRAPGDDASQTDRIAQAGQSLPAVAQSRAVAANDLAAARPAASPARQSLSDLPVSDAPVAASANSVVPVGHTTPVAVAARPFAVPVRGPWCPPQGSPMVGSGLNPQCGPQAPPCASCGPEPMACGPESGCPNGLPCGAWTPPGLACPWPEDEYLCDGGDQIPGVRVRQNWKVDGLQLEDTVVHYDTVQGDTYVEPSNRVCLYAPRFAAVRKVYGILQHDHQEHVAGLENPIPPLDLADVQIATTTIQPVQPGLNLGTAAPSAFRERTPPTGLENSQALTGAHGGLLPYEDFTLIRRGLMDNSEKARLADRVEAAAVWSHDAAVQVVIDNVALHEDVSVTQAESLHIYSLEGKPRLQVCKIASRKEARPGETVEFTIRFDNVGDQAIGNVTVIDNLTTRLEYVVGSQSCTLKANFAESDNQGDSLTLRWEIVEPMKVSEGGVIRFQCRVR
ncbi:MAG: hypothetical protein ACYC3X_03535 [Pirellulaceae bacterium]